MSIMKMFDEPDKEYNSKDAKKAADEWVRAYKEKLNLNYRVCNPEKAMLKRLLKEFELTDTLKVINYYINNYENIPYIKGYPSINAMMGFGRTLFPEVLTVGKDGFDFKLKQGGDKNGNKTCW